MAPTQIVGCQVLPEGYWRPTPCVVIDGDVEGHAFTPTHTATISLSWREEPNGERQIEFTTDDPDARAVLMEVLNRNNGASSDRPAATS